MKGGDIKATSVVDTLVKLAVRSVLFPSLKGSEGSPGRSTTKLPLVDKRAEKLPVEAADGGQSSSFVVGDHYAYVLSYASWSDVQLDEEKRKLRRWLKTRLEKREQESMNPEQNDDESVDGQREVSEAAMLEAYALLTLFQNERALPKDGVSLDLTNAGHPTSLGLLHAQLDLYAKYFEKTQRRKMQHEVDVLPIQKMYQSFVQYSSQQR